MHDEYRATEPQIAGGGISNLPRMAGVALRGAARPLRTAQRAWPRKLSTAPARVDNDTVSGAQGLNVRLDLSAVTRADLRAYMDATWDLDEALFACLRDDAAFLQVPWHGLRRPHIFYYGHSAAFYMNKAVLAGLCDDGQRPLPAFDALFEVGVDEMPWDDMTVNSRVWPHREEVSAFRSAVRHAVDRIVNVALGPSAGPVAVGPGDRAWALVMAAEHQRIHMETSTALFRELPEELLVHAPSWPSEHPSADRPCSAGDPEPGRHFAPTTLLHCPGGRVRLGRPEAAVDHFGWDLEYGAKDVDVPPFLVGEALVTNGEFHAFVADGGYRRADYWTPEAWAWLGSSGLQRPQFWVPRRHGDAPGATPGLRTMLRTVDMQWDFPVVVSHHEARAFCAWLSARDGRSYRLLAEAEHALLRPDRHDARAGEVANWHLMHGSECPSDCFPAAPSGPRDLLGNLWEHCVDAVAPFPGFEPHALYPDYSSTSFEGHHFTMLGGSFATTGSGASPWCRTYFRPHFYQHAGFRLATAAG